MLHLSCIVQEARADYFPIKCQGGVTYDSMSNMYTYLSSGTANLQPYQSLQATDTPKTFTAPNYPSLYLSSQDYTWIINTVMQTQIITLNVSAIY